MFFYCRFVCKVLTVIIVVCQTIPIDAESIELIDSLSHLIDYFRQHPATITPDAVFGINFLKCIYTQNYGYLMSKLLHKKPKKKKN